ncbi:hypothetical protein [Natronorubrum daqingense]|uniref:Uncharacterized protein n=1 Tax=Natronorubrum daqingense TaxID=588898 RepID=A0A1N7G283_9EURY|nr:hypothetical protein [Natronorubrum daqingense]APX98640.1 hypothetical protein BB347_18285 [Natronorubrum daqingense]SIS06546.1 hypothetical protein SAMN05421809_3674 [Natronorubrum daqingense]
MASSDSHGATRHVEQSTLPEWRAYEIAGETIVAHNVPEGLVVCYRVVGATRNARALASSSVDAVLYDGTLVEPFYDDSTGAIRLQHTYAGIRGRLTPAEWLEESVVKLQRCERVSLSDHFGSMGGGHDV